MGSADIPFDNTLFKNRIESVAEQNRKYKFKWKRKKNKLLSRLDFLLLQTKKKEKKKDIVYELKLIIFYWSIFPTLKPKWKKSGSPYPAHWTEGAKKIQNQKNWTKNKCEIYSNSLKKYCEHVT